MPEFILGTQHASATFKALDLFTQGLYARNRCYDEHQAGIDFWLTRNGHGAGFWDRDLGEIGDKLTAAAETYRELGVYLGDDEQVHLF